jgi:hypothetical protein
MMEKLRYKISLLDETVKGFKSENDIWNEIGDLNSRSFIIIFNNNTPDHQLQYTIRSKNNHYQTDQQYSKNLPEIATKVHNDYISDGFIGLQHAIDLTFFETIIVKDADYNVQMERLPSPPEQPVASRILDFGIYFIIFAALICISLIFTRVVEEKACGFREQLKNATQYSFLNNVALFTANFLQMLLLFYIILLITYIKGLWFSVNVFYAVLLIAVFLISIISFTFLVSAFFESSK